MEYWSHPIYRKGELVGAVVNFVDITERKRMEEALRGSEERYRLISNVTTDLLYSCVQSEDGFFTVDWATASVERIFGYSLDEILERGCWRCFVHPDDLPEFDRNITHLGAGQRSECELRISRQGRFHPLHPRLFQGGGIGRAAPFVWRLSGHHRTQAADEALRESEARFRAMAEHSADWIWAIDTLGRHTYSNQRGVASLGYTVEEFLALDSCEPGASGRPGAVSRNPRYSRNRTAGVE